MKIISIIFLILFFAQIVSARIDDRIDLNLAGVPQLLSLYGIDEQDADNIIRYRNTKGEYKKIEDVITVIGADKFELIKYDIKATPLESRFRDALSGYFYIEDYHWNGDGDPQAFGKFKVSVYDAVEVYQNRYKKYYNYSDIFKKDKWNYERNVTFNFYQRINLYKKDDRVQNHPVPKLFETIDVKKEKEKETNEAINFLENYFKPKPIPDKRKKEITASEYAYSDFDAEEYLKTKPARDELKELNKAKIRYIRNDKNYSEIAPRELPAEEDNSTKEIPNKKHFKKILKQKVILGNIYLPSVRTPLVAKSSSEYITGVKAYQYEKDWNTSIFYGNMKKKNGEVYGAEFNFDVGKNAEFSMVGYQMSEDTYGNQFPCLSLSGSKKISRNTSISLEYGNAFGKAYGLYGKMYTSMGDYSLTTTYNAVVPTYNSKQDLYPYWSGSYNNFQGFTDASFRLSYKYFKYSRITLDIDNILLKDWEYGGIPSSRRTYSLNYSYHPKGKWELEMTSSYGTNNYSIYKFKNNFKLYATYKFDDTSSIRWKANEYAYINKHSTTHTFSYNKDFGKLSIGPDIYFYHNDYYNGTGVKGYIDFRYELNRDAYITGYIDDHYDLGKDNKYDIEKVYHIAFKTSF